MSDNLLGNFTDQAKNVYEPLVKANQLLFKKLEKVAEFQMEAFKSYADMTGSQFKEILEVRDLESLKNYTTHQTEMASNLARKVVEDMKTLSEMGMEFKGEMEQVLDEAKSAAQNSKSES